jgi:hypothetical protein
MEKKEKRREKYLLSRLFPLAFLLYRPYTASGFNSTSEEEIETWKMSFSSTWNAI